MCRFVVYRGSDISMADLLSRSNCSLIRQSYDARERKEPLSGDRFGVGWYVPGVDPFPCVFTRITPAWSNRNLHRLTDKIRTGARFELRDGAYRMASTGGSPRALIVAPEPLTDVREDWERVPTNHLVVVSAELDVRLVSLQ